MKIMTKSLLTLSPVALALLLPMSHQASAHGYISKPEARGYLCRLRENTHCGNVVYEPQSLEGQDRFPQSGPIDGHIASAGLRAFGALDDQSINRWTKRHIKTGPNEFSWRFTAAHSSRDWRYFITKTSWDPNSPLTRDQFETVPFCEYQGYNRQPPKTLTHLCNVPERTGYHVVLGVWDVADTPMSFYNVVDVMIDNDDTQKATWQDVGDIVTGRDLKVGDKVKTRVFGDSKEIPSLQTVLTINNENEGLNKNWTIALAEKINASQSWIQAGQLNENNEVKVTVGRNEIFAQSNAGISSVELEFEMAPLPKPDFSVTGVSHNYLIEGDAVNFDFTVNLDANAQIQATLNKSYNSIVTKAYEVVKGQSQLSLNYPNAETGHYNLTISYITNEGVTDEKMFHLNIVNSELPVEPTPPVVEPIADVEFIFPESLARYKAGTVVLQPKNNKVYQCKPWPYNGYCVQWSQTANQYEPGVGLYWNMAWIEIK
ncbi:MULTISPECIES: N-acetylglucosamine-binding protein GbpA [unclassified Pseudoalteromonas]|uniref:N-acetylglucosamine-binding protein GbpA n=1 Tax=unclassified Pseudoalteromonas TaxID=194690 RepID=UPI000C07EA2F|nr:MULTISPECIES: N-acetylglucosamine-binding protein GbpA [unclassified Pseudoalteromonas]MDP2633813.1 N-acetylglucosamine-binding protein GbpA [Pseudoalteromonas sp. 1_MG-2023]PHN88973.1 N-acetylglucosamine-binding protein GbpA [Pseudoalteromonas sp. 3D05]